MPQPAHSFDMAKVLMTIKPGNESPSLQQVIQKYGLEPHEIDDSFGVVPIDPQANLYSILVEDSAASKIHSSEDWSASGPFSNPIIETFGPPRE